MHAEADVLLAVVWVLALLLVCALCWAAVCHHEALCCLRERDGALKDLETADEECRWWRQRCEALMLGRDLGPHKEGRETVG